MPWRAQLAKWGVGRAIIGVVLSLVAGAITAYIAVSVALGTTADRLERQDTAISGLRAVDAHHERRIDEVRDALARQEAADLLSLQDRRRIEKENLALMAISGEMRRELARLTGAVETLTTLLQTEKRP